MAGIRGFSDPNVQINPGDLPVWYQPVNSSITNATDYLLPWYLNYLGGNWSAATQCMVAGDNGWNGEPYTLQIRETHLNLTIISQKTTMLP